jgi:sporulation protein YlmC with PRC-barrel domain
MRNLTAPMSVAALALASTSGVALAQNYDVDPVETGSIGDDAVTAEIISLPEWQVDRAFLEGTSVDDLIGMDVLGPEGEDIGQLENVIFDENGKVLSVVAEVGGLWELDDTHVSIPWSSVEVTADGVGVPITEDTCSDSRP